ncbi:MAG TPA: hydrogenase maturation nickel metallochaperone HypA [Terriglobia bacterium]|nr:hydrogenase maturation nickel metallochaperone HypA [Terriglobia bacterium]
MHESSLMAGLMRQVDSIARSQKATKVVGVKVKLGALSHMSPEHFQEHFDVASRGTLAEGAALSIEILPDLSDPHAQEILLDSIEVEE